MIRARGHVTVGGARQEFTAGPPQIALWEAYASQKQMTIEQSPITFAMYLAWASSETFRAQGFEGWMMTVEDIEMERTDEVPPTEAASAGPSE